MGRQQGQRLGTLAHCEWDGSRLILQADNDFDSNGFALLDEFSDAISASITDCSDGGINVVSVYGINTFWGRNHHQKGLLQFRRQAQDNDRVPQDNESVENIDYPNQPPHSHRDRNRNQLANHHAP